MDYFQTLILSFVEGVTEFLPISSTGHLILTSEILKIQQSEFVKSFEIIIQLGAIFAILFLYWKTFTTNIEVLKRIFIAFIPTGILGLIFYKVVKQYLIGNDKITLLALFIGGVLLIILELIYKEKEHHVEKVEDLSFKKSFLIGIFQSISMIPGVSRSAATIIGGLFLGTKRKVAVEFSFLLAVPTMLAASGLDLIKTKASFTSYEYSVLLIGLLGSFIFAILAVKFFLQFIQKHTFIPFGVYRIIVSVLFYLLILK
ncbi:MAG: undecaprenyl-diphosphate phosphatase [bacterium]|nr:undecaprenyl-diphosphate phosphatase [bacterium]